MSYLYGIDTAPDDPAVQAALARLRVNYPQMKTLLVSDANALINPGFFQSLSNKAWSIVSTAPDQNAAIGQSILNAVQRYDETMNLVLAGDYSKAADLQANMERAVSDWGPSNDRPWSDLMNSIIADLKTLPRTVGEAAGAFVKDLAAGAASGSGTTGIVIAGVAVLAAGLYLLGKTSSISRSFADVFRKNPAPRRRAKHRRAARTRRSTR